MKPDYLSQEEYERLMVRAHVDVDRDSVSKAKATLVPSYYEVTAAGLWLDEQLLIRGIGEAEHKREASTFAEVCLSAATDQSPWTVAMIILTMWRNAHAPN